MTCSPTVTQLDALAAIEAVADEIGFDLFREAPGSLLLTPGLLARMTSLKKVSVAMASRLLVEGRKVISGRRSLDDLPGAAAREFGSGVGAASIGEIRVDLLPGVHADGHGLAIAVSSADAVAGEAFVKALVHALEAPLPASPGSSPGGDVACDGTLEDFLADGLPGGESPENRDDVKELCRRKTVFDWYSTPSPSRAAAREAEVFAEGGPSHPALAGGAAAPMAEAGSGGGRAHRPSFVCEEKTVDDWYAATDGGRRRMDTVDSENQDFERYKMDRLDSDCASGPSPQVAIETTR